MPEMGYMVPLEQRRRIAELYGDTATEPTDTSPTLELASNDPTDIGARAADVPDLAPARAERATIVVRCRSCRYPLGSVGHATACGDRA